MKARFFWGGFLALDREEKKKQENPAQVYSGKL